MFARGVAAEFREGTASKVGPLLLTIIACSLLVSGPLVTEPSTAAPVTLHGQRPAIAAGCIGLTAMHERSHSGMGPGTLKQRILMCS